MAVQLTVDPNQDLDSLLATLKAQSSKDVVLVLPQETRALQTLDNFYALRKEVRDANINLSFVGGNKTVKGLAKLLGFNTLDTAPVGGDEPAASFGAPPSGGRSGGGGANPFGLGDGFVVQQPGANGGGSTFDFGGFDSAPSSPPPSRSSRDIFNEMSSFDPGIPNQGIKPPPIRGGNGGGDTPLTRENIPDFFDSADGGGGFTGGGGRSSASPPRAAMDFGSGDNTGSKTMSFEEAMRSGIFPGGQGQLTNSPLDSIDNDDDFGDPSIPDADDNAASDFRSPGVRTSVSNRSEKGGRKPKGNKPGKKPARAAASGGVLAAINKIINPVEPRKSDGITMVKLELSPEEKARRDRQRRNATLVTWLSVGAVALVILASLLFFVLPRGGQTQGPGVVTLLVPVKPQSITSTIQIQLQNVPAGTTGQPATPGTGAATPVATTAAATVTATGQVATATVPANMAILPVEIVNTGDLKKSGEVAATGARKVPEKAAEGPVTIQNASFGARTFAAGTVVATRNGVTYRLKGAVTVGGIGGDGRVGSAGGTVVADKAGPVGNSDSFTIVSGNARFFVGKVEGGTERDEKVVQQPDFDNLQKQLTEQVRNEAANNVRYNAEVQSFLAIRQTDVKCEFNKKVGDAVEDSGGKLTGSCQMAVEGIIYNKTTAAQLAEANLIKDKTRYQLPDKPAIALSQPRLIEVNGQRVIQVEASGLVLPKVDEVALKAALANKPKTEIPAIVQAQFPLIDVAAMSRSLEAVSDASLPDINRLVISMVSSDAVAAPAGTMTAAPAGSPAGAPTTLPQGGNVQPAPVLTTTTKP